MRISVTPDSDPRRAHNHCAISPCARHSGGSIQANRHLIPYPGYEIAPIPLQTHTLAAKVADERITNRRWRLIRRTPDTANHYGANNEHSTVRGTRALGRIPQLSFGSTECCLTLRIRRGGRAQKPPFHREPPARRRLHALVMPPLLGVRTPGRSQGHSA
jgi:hypothetical protein